MNEEITISKESLEELYYCQHCMLTALYWLEKHGDEHSDFQNLVSLKHFLGWQTEETEKLMIKFRKLAEGLE